MEHGSMGTRSDYFYDSLFSDNIDQNSDQYGNRNMGMATWEWENEDNSVEM